MKRRPLCLWVVASGGWPATVHPQRRRTARIGVLHDAPSSVAAVELMLTRLAELGWSEVRNLSVEHVLKAAKCVSAGTARIAELASLTARA